MATLWLMFKNIELKIVCLAACLPPLLSPFYIVAIVTTLRLKNWKKKIYLTVLIFSSIKPIIPLTSALLFLHYPNGLVDSHYAIANCNGHEDRKKYEMWLEIFCRLRAVPTDTQTKKTPKKNRHERTGSNWWFRANCQVHRSIAWHYNAVTHWCISHCNSNDRLLFLVHDRCCVITRPYNIFSQKEGEGCRLFSLVYN